MTYTIDRLGNTTFALRPDYDSCVMDLGEPPIGVPAECTFEWGWDLAVKRVDKATKLAPPKAAVKAAPKKAPVRKAVAKKATVRKAPAKPTGTAQ